MFIRFASHHPRQPVKVMFTHNQISEDKAIACRFLGHGRNSQRSHVRADLFSLSYLTLGGGNTLTAVVYVSIRQFFSGSRRKNAPLWVS